VELLGCPSSLEGVLCEGDERVFLAVVVEIKTGSWGEGGFEVGKLAGV
jgi:hypothetical protein